MRHCPITKDGEEIVVIVVEKAVVVNTGHAGRIEGLTNEVERSSKE